MREIIQITIDEPELIFKIEQRANEEGFELKFYVKMLLCEKLGLPLETLCRGKRVKKL